MKPEDAVDESIVGRGRKFKGYYRRQQSFWRRVCLGVPCVRCSYMTEKYDGVVVNGCSHPEHPMNMTLEETVLEDL